MKKTSVLLIASSLFLAACGGANNDGSNPGSVESSAPAEVTISKQFIGRYDEMAGFGFDYVSILNLYSDNTLQLSGYNILSKDTSDYKENRSFSYDWGNGAWKMDKDEEGDDALILSIKFGADAYNIMAGENLVGTNRYSAYPKADGSCSFTATLPIVSGRDARMECDGTVKFNDYNAFIDAYKYVFQEPTNSVAQLNDAEHGYRIYCLDDKSAVYVSGGANGGQWAEYKKGTWNYDGELSFTFDEQTTKATVEGTTATWTDVWDGWGYADPVNLTLTGDISAIIASYNPTEKEVKYTFQGETATYTMYTDGTGLLKTSMGGHDLQEESTWTWANYQLSVMKGETEVGHGVPDGTTYQLSWTYHHVVVAGTYEFDYTFTCGAGVYTQW